MKKTNELLIELLVDFLPTDRDSAVNQSEISDYLSLSKRSVRQLVQQARHEGYPICSTPYDGYWLSSDANDISSTIAILRSQVNTLTKTIYDLENCIGD
jgi:biotin operon repressor